MRPTKLLLTTAALLILLGPVAYVALSWSAQMHPELRRLRDSVEYTEPLYREYRDGDYAHAKAAMLKVVSHLEEYEAVSLSRGVEYHNTDVMLAYVRLANLEAKHGGSQGKEFMREALARCERLKRRKGRGGNWRRTCDEPTLRRVVELLDANIK